MSALFGDRLARRRRSGGAEPLITYYDQAGAERTELSAITFGNWVDKTSNLLVDELSAEPGDVVELDLAVDHPGHWVTLVWVAAIWQVGSAVAIPGTSRVHAARPVLQVVGPARAQQPAGPVERLACRLHPLGLGFAEPLPDGVIDYAAEVRGQADGFVGAAADPDALAWLDARAERTQRDLVDHLPTGSAAESARRLVVPTDPWTTVRSALLAVITSGSAVIVRGAGGDDLRRIAAAELVTERA